MPGASWDHVGDLGQYASEVAALFESFKQRGNIPGNGIESEGSAAVRKTAGHPDGPGRLADGDGHVAVFKANSLRRQAVDMWCDVGDRTPVAAYRIAVHVINCDQDDIERLGSAASIRGGGVLGDGQSHQKRQNGGKMEWRFPGHVFRVQQGAAVAQVGGSRSE